MSNGIMKNTKTNLINLDNSYDLYLSMTWMRDNNHGICGHVYEIIDYYLLLYKKFKIGILICEDLTWEILEKCIRTKYNIDEKLINDIKSNTIFCNRPKYILGKNTSILFVDGGMLNSLVPQGVYLMVKNIFSFKCNYVDTHYNLPYKNVVLLQDNRIYSGEDNNIAINYVKKIGFKYYKKYETDITNTALLYCTTNCREVCNISLLDIIFQYGFKHYMLLTNNPSRYSALSDSFSQISFPPMPVEDIFTKFDTYIYTPTGEGLAKRKFDCSPRFIAECAHYRKEVIYHNIDEEYLSIDTGLKWRRHDIENNFSSLYLEDSDEIIDILYDRL
jgi:hypothetical protein